MKAKMPYYARAAAIVAVSSLAGIVTAQAVKSYFSEVYRLEASGYKFQVENKYGYLGAYQMGVESLIEAGFVDGSATTLTRRNNDWSKVRWLSNSYGINSKESFLSNKDAQDYAVRKYTDAQWQQAKNLGLDKYVGQTVQGVKISKEGILGMMHLKGGGGARAFLVYGEDPTDRNGTPVSAYARKLGNTKLDTLNPESSGASDALRCNTLFTYIGLWAPPDILATLMSKGMYGSVGGRNLALWKKIGSDDPDIRSSQEPIRSRLIERKRDEHISAMKPVYDSNPRQIIIDYDYCMSRGISSDPMKQR